MRIKNTREGLISVLEDMISYIENDELETKDYLKEIAKTGLFHDACGKLHNITDEYITTIEEY